MAIGFLAYAAFKAYHMSIKNTITQIIMLVALLGTYFLFKTPWVIPVLIILGGVATNFSDKRIPEKEVVKPKQIRWTNIWLFVLIFAVAGFLSETARKQNWENKKPYNLFENFYRFGSFVFGGGDVLIPLMLDQYVVRPTSERVIKKNPDIIKVEREELLTGAGMVRAIPGPVFSYCFFYGRHCFKKRRSQNSVAWLYHWFNSHISAQCLVGSFLLSGLAKIKKVCGRLPVAGGHQCMLW